MRKILAIIMAVALVCSFALTASAAETTIDDLTCGAFWSAHTKGIEVTTEGITITMTAKKAAPSANNYEAPVWIAFSSDNQLVNGENYAEYWVQRSDIYGWAGGAGNADNTVAVNGFSGTWDIYNQKLADGTQVTIYAIRTGDTITVSMECAGMHSKVTLPVAADKPAYLALTGEQCTMTGIKVVAGDKRTVASSIDSSTGFRMEYTHGIEVTEKEVVITATNTSKADNNWNGLIWILYKGQLPIPTADTDIYWIERPDNYGWSPAGSLATDEVNAGNAAAMEAVGVTHEGTFDATWGSWENFVAAQQAGAKVTIAAKREGNVVTVTMQTAGISNKVTVPVQADEPAYLCLSGDTAVITDIAVTGGNKPPKTGDETMLLPAAIALVLSATALVVLKKKH